MGSFPRGPGSRHIPTLHLSALQLWGLNKELLHPGSVQGAGIRAGTQGHTGNLGNRSCVEEGGSSPLHPWSSWGAWAAATAGEC